MVGPEWWIPALRAISDLNAYEELKVCVLPLTCTLNAPHMQLCQ